MSENRQLSVNEMKRILKPTGHAFLSLGAPPPLGFVDRAEWERILEGFIVERRGGFLQKWAAISKKANSEDMSGNYAETAKHYRFLRLRKGLGE